MSSRKYLDYDEPENVIEGEAQEQTEEQVSYTSESAIGQRMLEFNPAAFFPEGEDVSQAYSKLSVQRPPVRYGDPEGYAGSILHANLTYPTQQNVIQESKISKKAGKQVTPTRKRRKPTDLSPSSKEEVTPTFRRRQMRVGTSPAYAIQSIHGAQQTSIRSSFTTPTSASSSASSIQSSQDPQVILEQAVKISLQQHPPIDSQEGGKRKRTNYSTMTPAEEKVARERSKRRRADLKCKREKIRRTTLNTLMEEMRKELDLSPNTVDQANILSHALSFIRRHKHASPKYYSSSPSAYSLTIPES